MAGKIKDDIVFDEMDAETDISSRYAMDFLVLKNAIVDNCRDCIRDCGKDCLDNNVKPIENIRCPLQKVRMDYEISIDEQASEPRVVCSSKFYGFELK